MSRKHEIIKGDQSYPRKSRIELEQEDVIYQAGQFIQVLGENKRYVADGRTHFKDLKNYIDFPDDYEAYFDGMKVIIKKL